MKQINIKQLVSPVRIATTYLQPGKYRAKMIKRKTSPLDPNQIEKIE